MIAVLLLAIICTTIIILTNVILNYRKGIKNEKNDTNSK